MERGITYTINIEPAPQGGLIVTVPEIGAVTVIASTRRDDAVDAAHQAIITYLLKMREEIGAQAS